MRYLSILLLALLSTQSFAATPIGTLGWVNNLLVGGFNFSKPDSAIVLVGTSTADVTNGFSTMRIPGATAGYPVTGGKTLTIKAMTVITKDTGSANTVNNVILGYADTDIGFDVGGATVVNPVYNVGGTLVNTNSATIFCAAVAGTICNIPLKFPVLATKYTFIRNPNSANSGVIVYLWGEES